MSPGIPNHGDRLVAPVLVLQEVIDDEVRTQFEMLSPAAVNSGQQSAGVLAQDESRSRIPLVAAVGIGLIGVFPSGATVVRLARSKPAEIAAGQCDETCLLYTSDAADE